MVGTCRANVMQAHSWLNMISQRMFSIIFEHKFHK